MSTGKAQFAVHPRETMKPSRDDDPQCKDGLQACSGASKRMQRRHVWTEWRESANWIALGKSQWDTTHGRGPADANALV